MVRARVLAIAKAAQDFMPNTPETRRKDNSPYGNIKKFIFLYKVYGMRRT